MKISASQIKTYKLCRKKWWLEKVKKLPTGTGSYGAIFGSVVHGVLERKQKGKDPYPDEWDLHLRNGDSDIARKLVAMYEPLEGIDPKNVERRFDIPLYKDITVVGYIDLYKEAHVIDHKTTGAMKWTLKPRELASNDQMLIYAKYVMDQYPDTKLVKLQHNVFLRSAIPRKKITVAYATKNAIMQRWDELKLVARDMKKDRVGPCPKIDMGDHCKAFGGCPFAPVCAGTLNEGQFQTARVKETKMADELARKLAALEARKRGAPKAPVQEPAPPALEPAAAEDLAKVAAVIEETIPDVKPVKKKRGRPRKKKVEDVGPTVRADLTLYVGCTPIKRCQPGVYISLEDAMRRILDNESITVDEYFESNAFDRRDGLVSMTGRWLVDHPPVSVIAPSASHGTPDEKSLIAALRLRADAVIEALG